MKGNSKTKFEDIFRGRANLVLLIFFAALLILLSRIFIMQIKDHRKFVDLASKQHKLVQEIFSQRGDVYMQNKNGELIPFAINKIQKNLTASPNLVTNPEEISEIIANILNIGQDDLLEKLSRANDYYEILAKNLSEGETEKIEKAGIKGIFLEEEIRRVYPLNNLASQIIGFVSKKDNQEIGQYGIERYYEHNLSGRKGFFEGVKDATGSWIALGKRIIHPPKNGDNLVLTLDYNIQFEAENILREASEKWKADSGNILVMEPATGKILAAAGWPSFNPNEFSRENDYSIFLDPIVESTYEFGSVVKPIIMAAGISEEVVTPDTTYTDSGSVKIGGYEIKNFDELSRGTQTMTQVLEKSLNTGVVYVSGLLGPAKQLAYLKKFGFGERTGIDLPGEVSGNIANLSDSNSINFAAASFGQGISLTPLQLASAIGSLANGGILMRPFVVEKKVDEAGNVAETRLEKKTTVVSRETADTLTRMLVSVVRNGYDNRAGVDKYFVAGKTGTAQISKKDGKGYSDEVIHSFIGYAPAFNPRFIALIQLNNPKGNRFAANTLPPYFQELAKFILNYYEIPPDEEIKQASD